MEAGPDKNALRSLRIDRTSSGKSRTGLGLVIILFLLMVAAAAAVWWWFRSPAITVRTAVVREIAGDRRQTVLNASGYVTARRQATVSSKVTGKVLEVMVEEGLKVQEGQILARLDDSNIRANLRLIEAQYQVSLSTVEETRTLLVQAQKELNRYAELAKNQIATASELDRAESEVNTLKARLERQDNEVKAAERQIAIWQQQLEDMVIRAPFTGIVISKNAQPGEMISPMSAGGYTRTGICTIVDMSSLEVEVDVSESYIGRVTAGQSVQATLDSYPEWKIPSRVIAIIPTADRQKATVKVRIGFEKLDPRILPDMGVKVAFQGADESPVASGGGALVPKTALRKLNGRDSVLVLQNGKLEQRAVTIASIKDEEALINAGLASGEKVVVEGPDNLREGDRVVEAKP
jgi:RND family efflux transporter MFP subunit